MNLFTKNVALFSIVFSMNAFSDVKPNMTAPNFELKNLSGEVISLNNFKGKYVVLEWFNKDCPYVKKHYLSGNMQNLQKTYTGKDVVWLTINSNAPGTQGNESVENSIKTQYELKTASTHYLIDQDGKVGQLYGAKTTPHIWILNPKQNVIYTGAIDDKSTADQKDIARSKNYVSTTLDLDMSGKPVETKLTKPYGCGVKY